MTPSSASIRRRDLNRWPMADTSGGIHNGGSARYFYLEVPRNLLNNSRAMLDFWGLGTSSSVPVSREGSNMKKIVTFAAFAALAVSQLFGCGGGNTGR